MVGGSRSYVERAAKELTGHRAIGARCGRCAARRRRRRDPRRRRRRAHASTEPSSPPTPTRRCAARRPRPPTERAVLGAFRYSRNETVLHTDASLLPTRTAAPGRRGTTCLDRCDGERRRGAGQLRHEPAAATRRARRLRRHAQRRRPGRPTTRCSRGWTTSTRSTRAESVAAQRRLPALNDERIAFAGAYHGWGFHEDGCALGRPGRRGASGSTGDGAARPATRRARCAFRRTGALYRRRSRTRARSGCATRSPTGHLWLVDLDALPALPPGSPVPRCALRGPRPPRRPATRSIRDNLDAFLADHGVDPTARRVLMLANARSFGLRVQPAHRVLVPRRRTGRCACVVAEVHNTYGERHCYLLRPDADGPGRTPTRSSTSRRSSPSTGSYQMRFTDPRDDELRLDDRAAAATSDACSTRRCVGGRAPRRRASVLARGAAPLRSPASGS